MRVAAGFLAGVLLSGAGPDGPAICAAQEPGKPESAPKVTVTAPEPRYVAPTLKDQLGRIWAPVFINGRGPYRLVLDTGASHSAIIAQVAQELGLAPADTGNVLLHGVTGSATVAAVRADSLTVGDLQLATQMLPIVPDALGGAQGVLGVEGMANMRIFIDFMHDRINITRSHSRRAESGFIIIPVHLDAKGLLRTEVHIGGVRAQAIIDTGGQVTVGNLALKEALLRHQGDADLQDVSITGATDDVQPGQSHALPPILMGQAIIQRANITFSDLRIFDLWRVNSTPTLLIGMDTLGLLDTLVIDYQRQELQIRVRSAI